MAKQTIDISKDGMRIVNVIKAVMDIKNISGAVSFIIQDYAKTESYSKFIEQKRGEVKLCPKKR